MKKHNRKNKQGKEREEEKKLVTLSCMVCGTQWQGEEPKMCCSGHMCGGMGQPIDPIICSEECYNKLPFRIDR